MIIGSVNSRREAIIQLDLLGSDGERQTVDAVIDTELRIQVVAGGRVIVEAML